MSGHRSMVDQIIGLFYLCNSLLTGNRSAVHVTLHLRRNCRSLNKQDIKNLPISARIAACMAYSKYSQANNMQYEPKKLNTILSCQKGRISGRPGSWTAKQTSTNHSTFIYLKFEKFEKNRPIVVHKFLFLSLTSHLICLYKVTSLSLI